MASSPLHLTLLLPLSLLSLFFLQSHASPFVLPLKKDPSTLQYFTSIQMGISQIPLDLVIDLSGRFLWFECGKNYNSSSYNPARCGSKTCKISQSRYCNTCDHPLKTGCTNHTCAIDAYNPAAEFFVNADIGDDTLSLSVPHFVSACVYPEKFGVDNPLEGLANGTKGVLGFARTAISFPSQISSRFKLPRKFSLCLPSKTEPAGSVFAGGEGVYHKFLTKSPLLVNPISTGPYNDGRASYEYFIDVKSIQVEGKALNLNTSLLSFNKQGHGGTKISTVTPYTKLQRSIYNALVGEFVKKAEEKKMKRVRSVKPFGTCYDAASIKKSVTGPDVPIIDLVLGGGAKWRIYGANSMVKVGRKGSVVCLGFVDGGLEPTSPVVTSIVIGGYQLEDNLVEFDVDAGKFGITSSLLLHNATCTSHHAF